MAVFVAARDESERGDQTGPFVFGGWVAPALHWLNVFTPAWERRVLNPRPALDFFHMTSLASPDWREANGWEDQQAEARIDESLQVIKNAKGLNPVVSMFDGEHFRDVFGKTRVLQSGKQAGIYDLEPDYVGFLGFVLSSLHYVATKYPDAERVEFVVEKKTTITHHIEKDFHPNLEQVLRHEGLEYLIPLIGDFTPRDKKYVPLQAADVLIWHYRKWAAREATDIDSRRLRGMLKGRLIARNVLTAENMNEIEARNKARNIQSPFKPKQKRA